MHHRLFQYTLLFLSLTISNHAFSQDNAPATSRAEFKQGEEFSIQKAMMVLFGNISNDYESTYTPGKVDDDQFSNKQLIYMPLAHKVITQEGNKYIYFVTYALPSIDFVCHACSTLLGIYVFEQKNGKWELIYFNPNFGLAGKYGTPPDVRFIKIGYDITAISFTYSDYSWGTLNRSIDFNTFNNNSFNEIFSTQTFYSEECDEDESDCVQNETDIYAGQSDGKYYTIKTVLTGLEKGEDGKAFKIEKNTFYKYNNTSNKYEQTDSNQEQSSSICLSTNRFIGQQHTVYQYFDAIKNKMRDDQKEKWSINEQLGIKQLFEGKTDPAIKYFTLQNTKTIVPDSSRCTVDAVISIEDDKASLTTWNYSFILERKGLFWEIYSVDRYKVSKDNNLSY